MACTIDLNDRCALVTGASRGIGRAIALLLAEAGANVAVNYARSEEKANAAAQAARGFGRKAIAVRADVSDGAAVQAMLAAVEKDLGPVDVLVNNAAVAPHRGLDDLTEADFDYTLAVNLKSAFLCTQAVLPHMRTQRWGRIVNISSGAGHSGGVVGVHYNASKVGMEGLMRGYAARLVKEGITVNAVSPSLIDTDMIAGRPNPAAGVPLGRLGRPEEVAQVVLMVVANPYMTGQVVPVNGGTHFN
jgi:3-oxoacyl-[acyl-carrier protein] reductase